MRRRSIPLQTSLVQTSLVQTSYVLGSCVLASLAVASLAIPARAQAVPAPTQAVQAPRLVDCIEAPLAYVCLHPIGPTQTGPTQTGPHAAPVEALGAVQRLLGDPSLDQLFGGVRAESAPSSANRALAVVRGVLGRSSGDLELALTGVVPTVGQPLLVLRVRLQGADADRLQALLGGDSLARPHRVLGGKQTYRLPPAGGGGAVQADAGQIVELALIGTDLLVSTDGLAMQEVLAPAPATTSAGPKRRVLSADPRFTSLRSQLTVPPGSLLLYGDWQRLGKRLHTSLAGLPGAVLDSSGLGSAGSIMISIAAAQTNFAATVLLDFDAEGAPANRAPTSGAKPQSAKTQTCEGIDGWFAAAQSVPARSLLPELPGGGLGGLVIAVDLESIATRSHRGAHMLRELRDAFRDYGLDFDRNVLGRLGSHGTVQLLVRRGEGDVATEVTSVYSVRAKSRKGALDLFEDLQRASEAHGIGRFLPGKSIPAKDAAGGAAGRDRRSPDVIELKHGRQEQTVCVAVFEEHLLLAADAETLVQVHDEFRRSTKLRSKREQFVANTIQAIGGESIAGLFDLDLQPLFEHVAGAFARASAPLDLAAVPKRHVGYVDLQPREGGTVMRICVLSSR
ncbi:MAG: hypothetical protein ABIP94_04635 [Planctomycetota bacterium]